jgi:serpin B
MWAELADLNNKLEQRNDRDANLHAQAAKLAASINQLAGRFDAFDLKIANSLWGEKTCPFEPAFVAEVDRIFGAGSVRPADFINNYPAERVRINHWVEQQTNDRIKDLLPELSPIEARALRLVLVNAIWFKGEWSTPFDENATADGDFLLPGGGKMKAKLMHQTIEGARYADFDGMGEVLAADPRKAAFSIVELPIKGKRLAMMIIAPGSPDGLPKIESMLTETKIASWVGHLKPNTVQVTLPRYRLETDYSLGETLKMMGMPIAFTAGADFSGMTHAVNLCISRVEHKAFVEVNEKGAEAAAATAVMVQEVSARYEPIFQADRPFLFLIRDTESGMILSLGRVIRPT